jgi:hypothetical protein
VRKTKAEVNDPPRNKDLGLGQSFAAVNARTLKVLADLVGRTFSAEHAENGPKNEPAIAGPARAAMTLRHVG